MVCKPIFIGMHTLITGEWSNAIKSANQFLHKCDILVFISHIIYAIYIPVTKKYWQLDVNPKSQRYFLHAMCVVYNWYSKV